jgi:hypothetical protein
VLRQRLAEAWPATQPSKAEAASAAYRQPA